MSIFRIALTQMNVIERVIIFDGKFVLKQYYLKKLDNF